MKSAVLGDASSAVEVSHVSAHGIWLLAHGHELFMAYEDFPWFLDQPIRSILNIEEPSEGHFFWPDLDIDLSVEMIEFPQRFPLRS